MKSLKEIFTRQPEKMSRLVRRFFTIPISYILYIVISLLIPQNLGLVSVLLSYCVLLLSLLLCTRIVAGVQVSSIVQPAEKFRIKHFFEGFSIMAVSGILLSFLYGFTGINTYICTFDSSSFVFDWAVSLLLVLTASFVEEFIFRGFVLHFVSDEVITGKKKKLIYAAVSGLLFTINHFQNPEVSGPSAIWAMAFYFVMGFSLMLIAINKGGIEATWGIHFANNLITAWLTGYNGSVISTNCVFTQINPIGPMVVVEGAVCMLLCNLILGKCCRKSSD